MTDDKSLSNNAPPLRGTCRGKCDYDPKVDKCYTCGRTMEQIRNAYSSSNKVRM
jgi:predicted Fe-S protein YdhL (DUF1289 family)